MAFQKLFLLLLSIGILASANALLFLPDEPSPNSADLEKHFPTLSQCLVYYHPYGADAALAKCLGLFFTSPENAANNGHNPDQETLLAALLKCTVGQRRKLTPAELGTCLGLELGERIVAQGQAEQQNGGLLMGHCLLQAQADPEQQLEALMKCMALGLYQALANQLGLPPAEADRLVRVLLAHLLRRYNPEAGLGLGTGLELTPADKEKLLKLFLSGIFNFPPARRYQLASFLTALAELLHLPTDQEKLNILEAAFKDLLQPEQQDRLVSQLDQPKQLDQLKPAKANNENLTPDQHFATCCNQIGLSDSVVQAACHYPPDDLGARAKMAVAFKFHDYIGCYGGHRNNRQCCVDANVQPQQCQDLCDGANPPARASFKYMACNSQKGAIANCNRQAWEPSKRMLLAIMQGQMVEAHSAGLDEQ